MLVMTKMTSSERQCTEKGFTGNFHCINEHSSQPKWHFLWKSFAIQSDLKAIAQIDMQHLAGRVQHDVGRMSIAQT